MSDNNGKQGGLALSLGTALLALLVAGVALYTTLTQTPEPQTSTPDEQQIHQMVRGYILENPEILPEAIAILRQREASMQQNQLEALVADRWDDIRTDSLSPVVGAADAPVTVVEYYDYRCPYCRKAHPDMVRLLKEHGDKIRYVFKQFPVLDSEGPNGVSHFASRAAIAADRQGQFLAFHDKVMSDDARLDKARIVSFAKGLGLDMDQFHKDMDDPEINQYFGRTIALARTIGINGTPTYVINGKVLAGAHGYDAILSLVQDNQ